MYATCDFVHGLDWSTNPSLLEIDIGLHVRDTMMHVEIIDFFKITIGNWKFTFDLLQII